MSQSLSSLLDIALSCDGPLLFLTGAGISAESGIPTFRGEEGYWQVDSRHYHPQEMATQAAFREMPDEVWRWYLYRRGVCRAAAPNPAHLALVEVERRHPNRFVLITQNVDGLHLRAGNTMGRTWQIHGNIDYMRCVAQCRRPSVDLSEIPLPKQWDHDTPLTATHKAALVCSRCAGPTRPHVLWFDEFYDEPLYRYDSSLQAALSASLVVVIGTSGATNLPIQVGAVAEKRGVPFVVINPEQTPFTEMARRSPMGLFLQGTAGSRMPEVCDHLNR